MDIVEPMRSCLRWGKVEHVLCNLGIRGTSCFTPLSEDWVSLLLDMTLITGLRFGLLSVEQAIRRPPKSRLDVGTLCARMFLEIKFSVAYCLEPFRWVVERVGGCSLPSSIILNLSCVHSIGKARCLSLTSFLVDSVLSWRSLAFSISRCFVVSLKFRSKSSNFNSISWLRL